MKTVTLTLTDEQQEALMCALRDRVDAIAENRDALDDGDECDAANIRAYDMELVALGLIFAELEQQGVV